MTKLASKDAVKNVGTQLVIPGIQWAKMLVCLRGLSPLMLHYFPEKVRRRLLEGRVLGVTTNKTKAKEPRNPIDECIRACGPSMDGKPITVDGTNQDWHEGKPLTLKGRVGVVADCFKQSICDVAKENGIAAAVIKRNLQVHGTVPPNQVREVQEFIEVLTLDEKQDGKPRTAIFNESKVSLGGINHSPDLRFRPLFPTWRVVLPVTYNTRILNETTIVTLLDIAGSCSGVCEWRPGKSGGTLGTFKVTGVVQL